MVNTCDLKDNFHFLSEKINDINLVIEKLEEKVKYLYNSYKKLFKDNQKKFMIIGLDNLYFQSKLLSQEINNFKEYYKLIINRIYYDYYRLSKLISEFIILNIDNKKLKDYLKILDKYPKYDLLKIKKTYRLDQIEELFTDIINIIILFEEIVLKDKSNLNRYLNEEKFGLNINNFVVSYESNIKDIENKIELYKKTIIFYKKIHLAYLERLYSKLIIAYSYVNKDIKTEQFLSKSSKVVVENIDGDLQKKIIDDLCVTDECLTSSQSYDSDHDDMEKISLCIKKKRKSVKNEDILLVLQKNILTNI